jgi:hypothetical protein
MSIEELKSAAADLARALRESDTPPKDLRKRFIALRSELFQRGVFDPVLARFDTITVSRASMQQIADELEALADTLR